MLVLFAMTEPCIFRYSRSRLTASRSATSSCTHRRLPPKFPPSPRASAPRRRYSPTARSRRDFSKPRSAPNIIWPAGSTASGNTTCRCGCSPTATARTERRNWQKSSPTSGSGSGISTSRWPTASEGANVLVKLVRDRDLFRTITTFLRQRTGARNSQRRSIRNACPAFARTTNIEIEHSDVILTVDNGDFIFLDCAYEELLQSLGPINDTTSVPWTMFNDNVSMGFFDIYDQYIMNVLYDPRIKAGMTIAEVKSRAARGAPRRAGVGEEGQQSGGIEKQLAGRPCEGRTEAKHDPSTSSRRTPGPIIPIAYCCRRCRTAAPNRRAAA